MMKNNNFSKIILIIISNNNNKVNKFPNNMLNRLQINSSHFKKEN